MAEKPQPQGTHMQRRRPPEGWPSNTQPEQKTKRPMRKAREKLKKRQEAYERIPTAWKGGAYHKPGSTQIR